MDFVGQCFCADLRLECSCPLVFKEIYYAGSSTPTGSTYRNDNFYTVFNNSDEEQDISTLYIGMCENFGGLGETGPLWPGEETGNYSHVYLKSVWKITAGDDPVYLEPGQLIVIASMAAPHNRDEAYNLSSPVDLSGADYEAYVPDPENTSIRISILLTWNWHSGHPIPICGGWVYSARGWFCCRPRGKNSKALRS